MPNGDPRDRFFFPTHTLMIDSYFLPQAFAELNQITDQTILDNKVTDYNKEVSELWDKLMGLELQLVDQLEVLFVRSIYNQATSRLAKR